MSTVSQAQAAKYLLKLRDASETFEGFVRLCYPDWDIAPFQLELIHALDQLEKDQLEEGMHYVKSDRLWSELE